MNQFNPIKEDKEGVMAKRTIWSSKSIDVALKGLEQGRKLIANPFYENNTKILKGDLVFERTNEEIEEWKKCANDIIYFVEKYCKLMTPTGIQKIVLRDYQEAYLKHLEKNRLSIMLSARQAGKCLAMTCHVCVTSVDMLNKRLYNRYYINELGYYDIPLFELYNLCDHSFKWKLKYPLYKILHRLIWRKKEKEDRKEKTGNTMISDL